MNSASLSPPKNMLIDCEALLRNSAVLLVSKARLTCWVASLNISASLVPLEEKVIVCAAVLVSSVSLEGERVRVRVWLAERLYSSPGGAAAV